MKAEKFLEQLQQKYLQEIIQDLEECATGLGLVKHLKELHEEGLIVSRGMTLAEEYFGLTEKGKEYLDQLKQTEIYWSLKEN